MRIYTRVVYGWQPDGSLRLEEADSFEYEGPLALCKDSPSPPPAPDYAGAARATSAGSVQASIANNLMARPTINTPLGTQSWRQTGTQTIPGAEGNAAVDIPMYEQNINMTPEGQELYQGQLGLSKGLMTLGQGSLDQTTASLGQPQDFGSVQDIADQSYAAQTARLDPQWNERAEQQRTILANQGLSPGGQAYDSAQRNFDQSRNDAYTQARLAAQQTMPQTYQLATAQRMQPLTELNAIRTGAQPQMPQFQPTQYSMGAQGANQLGAAQAQNQYDMGIYNSEVGQQNSFMSGLMGLGGALGSAYIRSDRRLKSNIVRIGTHPLGVGWYAYDIDGKRTEGVMADEVLTLRPQAVARGDDGYLRVNYGAL